MGGPSEADHTGGPFGLGGASFMVARSTLRPMANANASFNNLVGASLMAANLARPFWWGGTILCFNTPRVLLAVIAILACGLFLTQT